MNGVEKEKTNEKMTVSELIEKLKNVPEDYDIRMCVPIEDGSVFCHDFTKDIEIDIYEEDKIVEICGL